MDQEYMRMLADNYMLETNDMLMIRFFDVTNTKNIAYKIEVLEWSLKNNKNATQYKDIEETRFYDNYPESKMWD